MTYRDDLEAARFRREALERELAEVQNSLAEHDTLIAREQMLMEAIAEAKRHAEEVRFRVTLPLLDRVKVASPCRERWEDMTGDERVRNCGRCEKDVYDLSAMTASEAEKVLATRGANLCVRFYRRADGTVMTSDCPEGVRRRHQRYLVAAGVALTVAVGAAGAAGGAAHRRSFVTMGEVEPSSISQVDNLKPLPELPIVPSSARPTEESRSNGRAKRTEEAPACCSDHMLADGVPDSR